MIGKGLEWTVIAELLVYTAATLVPLALPLSILFASLMTFGNLGEHYELVAFKASGTSLQRVMRPLIYGMICISVGAFLFSNYVLPITNLKSARLLWDVTRKKPAINIKPNIFYSEIDGFTIRIDKKSKVGDQEQLEGITIYNHTDNAAGNRSVTLAEKGVMIMSPDKQNLFIELQNGCTYEDDNTSSNYHMTRPFVRKKFRRDMVRFDLSAFAFEKTDEDLFRENYKMLNIQQLESAIDTYRVDSKRTLNNLRFRVLQEYQVYDSISGVNKVAKAINSSDPSQMNQQGDKIKRNYDRFAKTVNNEEYLAGLDNGLKLRTLGTAINMARTIKTRVHSVQIESSNNETFILKHLIEWHRKFTLSLGCLVLFFIGAPLGAIIRKGGLGMPAVVSVVFFVLYYVLSITGEKMAINEAVHPIVGMWMASVILLPLGIYITAKATSDSPLFDAESYSRVWNKIFRRQQ